MKYDYLIVGAGIFGATFAQVATEYGKKCIIIDKRSHIAGNAYTESMSGINVHKYGAHIFHTNNTNVWEYVNRFIRFNNFINSPIALYKNELYNLPFNMNTFAKLWNVFTPIEAREIIEQQRRESGIVEPKNLEEQAIYLVGRDIYERLIKGYTEKQWGINCESLPAFIIKRLPLRFIYDNNYFDDCYQGIPVGGYTQLVQNMLGDIEIKLCTNYFEFIRENSDVFEKIVYTGQIDEFFDYCYGQLEYRSLHFETEILDIDNYQGNAVVNYTEREIPYTRIIEHKHFDFGIGNAKKTVITKEYPVDWKPGNEPYYPINNSRNDTIYKKYKVLAKSRPEIIFGGRLGKYKYFDMDKVIEDALIEAERELGVHEKITK